ncbi:MAG: type II toxin-antitoxin system VapC family toxin [Paludibacter sp.]|nr:type II toxin-antitoxin system VapC family toxin [Paludibacter sp.]
MHNILLDTNILIHLVRGNAIAQKVKEYVGTINEPQLFVSVVNIAEAESLMLQWNWTPEKMESLKKLITSFITIDIEQNNKELLDAYISIDAYSQGKTPSPSGELLNNSSRNMGKNDLWIAATAYAMNAMLLTTDGDFDHLDKSYINLRKYAK